MKRYAAALAVLLCLAQPVAGQTTTISITIVQQDTISLRIVIASAFVIATDSADVPGGVEGMPYHLQLVTANVPAGHTVIWSLDSGSLPPGLSLQPTTGIISGVVDVGAVGVFAFVVSARTIPPGNDP